MTQVPWCKGLTKETHPSIMRMSLKMTGEGNPMSKKEHRASVSVGLKEFWSSDSERVQELRKQQSERVTGENNPIHKMPLNPNDMPGVREKIRQSKLGANNPMKRPEVSVKISGDNNGMRTHPKVAKRIGKERKETYLKNPYGLNPPFRQSKIEQKFIREIELRDIECKVDNLTFGLPDIFIKPNIYVFVDGCYWHCCSICGFEQREERISFDKKVTDTLRERGFIVLRFWEHELGSDMNGCIEKIKKYLGEKA